MATSDGLDKHAHPYSLTKAFAARIHNVLKWEKAQTKNRRKIPLDSCACMFSLGHYEYAITWVKVQNFKNPELFKLKQSFKKLKTNHRTYYIYMIQYFEADFKNPEFSSIP